MDDNKAFCVNCLNLVDPKDHHDCTLTFDNLLAAEERVDTANFQQTGGAATEEQPQMNDTKMLQGGTGTKKPNFANPIQQPSKGMSTDRNSTSARVLGVHNPGVQPAGTVDHGNSILNHNGGNRFLNEPTQAYNLINPLYSHFLIGQQIGQTELGSIQQENEFPNAVPQNNERNSVHQEYPLSSYGQNFITYALPPPAIPDFITGFPQNMHNMSMNAFGHLGYQLHFNYLQPQNTMASIIPQTTMASPNHNINVGNYPESIKTSPISPVASRPDKILVNKEKDLLAQSKLPSPCLVSKAEMQSKNGVKLDTVHHRYAKNYSKSSKQKIANSSTPQMRVESKKQKIEKKCTPQKNTNTTSPQWHLEQRVHRNSEVRISPGNHADTIQQKDEEKGVHQRDADESTQQKDAEKSLHQRDTDKSARQKDAEKCVQQRDAENSEHQKHEEKCIQQKDEGKCIQQKDEGKCVQQKDADYVQKKDEEKSAQQNVSKKCEQEMDSKMSMHEKDTEKRAHAKVVEKGAHAKNSENEQNEAGRFTGEGYKSIEEFIEALKNGTLYKRY